MILPTLMYHSVRPTSTDYLTVAREVFALQITHLATRYQVIGIQQALESLQTGRPVAENAIVITFDDSLADNIEYAVPILLASKLTATFFAITHYLGDDNAWDHKAYAILPHMTRADIAGLSASGFSIGSHTATHQRLSKLAPPTVEAELTVSRDAITSITGVAPVAVSYPYGDADSGVVDLSRRYLIFGSVSRRCDRAVTTGARIR